jgi:hypothetical protein
MDCLQEWDRYKRGESAPKATDPAIQRFMLLGLHMTSLPRYEDRRDQAMTIAAMAVQDRSANSMTDALWMVAELYAEACQKVQMDWFAEQVLGLSVNGLANQSPIRLTTDTDKNEQKPPNGPRDLPSSRHGHS